MKIYLKGYYGYQNFWDELLMFGVIEEIFSRYEVEDLVIEVGNTQRIDERIQKNQAFLALYYQERGVQIDRNRIHFFSPEEYFAQKSFFWLNFPNKWKSYINIFCRKHPFHHYFKIFWGGEVIDESRSFPHNWRNLLLLYTKTIFEKNFALRWGLGSQKNFFTRWLTRFLVESAKSLLLREKHSFHVCQHILWTKQKKAELFHDFSQNIINFWIKTYQTQQQKDITLINFSPSFDNTKRIFFDKKWISKTSIVVFPCDLSFDIINIATYLPWISYTIFNWTQSDLLWIFSLFSGVKLGIWSRLHFLYCLKQLSTNYITMSKSVKLYHNL